MSADHQPARDVLTKVIESGSISTDQVRELEQWVKQDRVVNRDEVQLLFQINQALGPDHDDCPEWCRFFTTTVCRLVVMDMNTPGQIDESEGDWLEGLFGQFSVGNTCEKKLLAELQKTTTSIAGRLSQRIQPD